MLSKAKPELIPAAFSAASNSGDLAAAYSFRCRTVQAEYPFERFESNIQPDRPYSEFGEEVAFETFEATLLFFDNDSGSTPIEIESVIVRRDEGPGSRYCIDSTD